MPAAAGRGPAGTRTAAWVHGSSVPARSRACRPRRIRSVISVRSVLRDRPADLQQQLIVRIGAHRPVQELHLAAAGGQLLDQQHLMDVVAGQPVRRGHHDDVQLGQRRMIAQPVQARPVPGGRPL